MPDSRFIKGPSYHKEDEKKRWEIWREATQHPDFRLGIYRDRNRKFGPEFT